MSGSPDSSVRKMVWAIAVILAFVALTGLLMSVLQSVKRSSLAQRLRSEPSYGPHAAALRPVDASASMIAGEPGGARLPLAHVKSFVGEIELTPKLSVGTERPESIYEAKFRTEMSAVNPKAHEAKGRCEIQLPLPPQLISVAEMTVSVNGEPSESLGISGDRLVWQGTLDAETPAKIEVTYTAIGKGIYTLTPPPGKIVDLFEAKLTAKRSDVRMLQLSLQPQDLNRDAGNTTYTWKYERLMFGRPIALDVLGIAPMDQLGELGWLGPIGVLVFGLLVAIVGLAYRPEKLDKWMLLLMIGAFAAAYPLMYFAQDFLPLNTAVIGATAVMLVIIAVRGVTLFGPVLGLLGTLLLAGAVQAVILCATIWPNMQGVLMTIMAIGTLVAAMVLLPRAQRRLAEERPTPPAPPKPPVQAEP